MVVWKISVHTKRSLTSLDYILLTLLLAAAGYVFYRITVHLDYSWNWKNIPGYIVRYDPEQERWVTNYLVDGFLTTIRLSIWGSILALILGLAIALARISSSLFLQLVSRSYIELMRNLPPLIIVFIFYFFLADQLLPMVHFNQLFEGMSPGARQVIAFFFGEVVRIPSFFSALITLAAFESAYVAEIFRAGIESIEKSQWEAGSSLGLKQYQTMLYIVFPQAIIRVLPPLAGQIISLIKDSAIVSVISVQELTYQGTQLMASTYMTIEVWTTIALMYLVLTFPCSLLVSYLESRYKRA